MAVFLLLAAHRARAAQVGLAGFQLPRSPFAAETRTADLNPRNGLGGERLGVGSTYCREWRNR